MNPTILKEKKDMTAPYTLEKSILDGELEIKALFQYVVSNAVDTDSYQIEKGIREQLNKIGLAAMKAYFAVKGTGDIGDSLLMEDGTELKKESGLRERVLFSSFGKLDIPRSCYRSNGQPGIMPLDVQANLPDRSYSYLLQEYMDILAIQSPFEKSSETLQKFLGFKIYSNRIETISQRSSSSYDQYYDAKILPEPVSEGSIVVASFDGVGVPLIKSESANIVARKGKGEKRQKKKEAIVGVSYTTDPNVRTAEEVAQNLIYPEKKQEAEQGKDKARAENIRRIASLERSKEEVFHEVLNYSRERNPDDAKPCVVIMDGALSLWSILMSFSSVIAFTGILDVIHVTEYLWRVANALYQEGTALGKKWVYDNLLLVLDGRVGDVIEKLEQLSKTEKLKKSQVSALKECIRYFNNHLNWMKYDEYLKAGYPIGSGVVESSCGHTVKGRMEGTGRRWSVEGAESILLLRSVHTSGDWDEYWQFHMKLEKSFHYHDALAAMGVADDFNELGMIEKTSEISACAA
jgi:hypothetical protein